jgi:hypothetical protein
MNAHKIASLVGMVTMGTTAAIELSMPLAFTQAGQPSGGTRATQPRNTQPNQQQPGQQPGVARPGTIQPRTSPTSPATPASPAQPVNPNVDPNQPGNQGTPVQPGVQPGMQPGVQPGGDGQIDTVANALRPRLFALDNSTLNNQLVLTGQRLANFEAQLQQLHQQLLQQLGQARQLNGERKVDALAQVVQGMLQEQRTLLQYLAELRVSLTGELDDRGLDGTGDGINNGVNTGNNPGVNRAPDGTLVPEAPRLNPGRPTTNPATTPRPAGGSGAGSGTNIPNPPRQNPGAPTTNPTTTPRP